MIRFWNSKIIAWITILAIAICGSRLTHVSSYAAERTVTVDNHTPILYGAKIISMITIYGLDKPVAGTGLDSNADVTRGIIIHRCCAIMSLLVSHLIMVIPIQSP